MQAHFISFFAYAVLSMICMPSYSSDVFLWKVTGNGIAKPSYILGTESTTSINVVQQTDIFHTCWNSTSLVMTTHSIPLQETSDDNQIVETLRKLGKHKDAGNIFMDSVMSYEKLYTPQQIEFIDSIITKYMPPLSRIRVVPFYLWNYLQEKEAVMNIDKAEKGKTLSDVYHEMMDWMEIALERKGKQEGRSYLSLENIQDEYHAIAEADSLERSCFTLDEQALIMYRQMLYKASHPLERTSEAVLKDLYKQQDFQTGEAFYLSIDNRIDSLGLPEQLTRKLHETSRKRREIEIENRSRKWLRPILSAIRQTPTLIAVDIKSLYGDESLLNLLRGVGYAVEPVMQE